MPYTVIVTSGPPVSRYSGFVGPSASGKYKSVTILKYASGFAPPLSRESPGVINPVCTWADIPEGSDLYDEVIGKAEAWVADATRRESAEGR